MRKRSARRLGSGARGCQKEECFEILITKLTNTGKVRSSVIAGKRVASIASIDARAAKCRAGVGLSSLQSDANDDVDDLGAEFNDEAECLEE